MWATKYKKLNQTFFLHDNVNWILLSSNFMWFWVIPKTPAYITHITYITHNSYNLHNSYGKVNFLKYVKKPINYLINLFPISGNVSRILSKKTKKNFKKRLVKSIKIFLDKKKQKAKIWSWMIYKSYWRRKIKSANMLVNKIEIFQKMKKPSWV